MTFKILKTFILELKGFWGPWPASQDAYAIKGSNVFQLMSWIEGWQNKSQFKSKSDFVSCVCNVLHASSPQPSSPTVSNEASPTSLVILPSMVPDVYFQFLPPLQQQQPRSINKSILHVGAQCTPAWEAFDSHPFPFLEKVPK